MKKNWWYNILLLINNVIYTNNLTYENIVTHNPPPVNNKSNFPYITGVTVRECCDHILDTLKEFDPSRVRPGDTIFVMINFLEYFFEEYHHKIQVPYILITHHFYDQSDNMLPGKFAAYLDDRKLIGWFTHNVDRYHPKLHVMPIGIVNSDFCSESKKDIIEKVKNEMRNIHCEKKLLYLNFSIDSYPLERQCIYDFFKTKAFCTIAQGKSFEEYYRDLMVHKFTLSPRGNGLDCFRTWEALLMGSYPIVKTSTLDPLFQNLPVVIVNDWFEITPEFLEQKYEELSNKKYMWEKLYLPYWLNEIREIQKPYVNSI